MRPHRLAMTMRGAAALAAGALLYGLVLTRGEVGIDVGLREPPAPEVGATLLAASFNRPDGLVLNEYPFWNRSKARAPRSRTWEITSGSLFARDGAGWTGKPDARRPNVASTNATGSAIFRLRSRGVFGNVSVSMSLLARRLVATAKTPPHAWDGVHVFLRYQSPSSLYVASVNRRDNSVVVKKKVAERPGARYYVLGSSASHRVPLREWQHVRTDVATNGDGSVTIALFIDGKRLLTATDRGVGGPPIRHAGRIGIRGDNTEFLFDDLLVRRIVRQ